MDRTYSYNRARHFFHPSVRLSVYLSSPPGPSQRLSLPGQRMTESRTAVRLAWMLQHHFSVSRHSGLEGRMAKKKNVRVGTRCQAAHFPILWTTQSCWHSGQRLFCLTHSDMQQLWKEWLHSPQTTAGKPRQGGGGDEEILSDRPGNSSNDNNNMHLVLCTAHGTSISTSHC